MPRAPQRIESSRFVLNGPDGGAANISELRTGFKQGFIFEVLDLESGRTIPDGVHVMVLNPQRYSLTEPFQVTLTPTENDTVVAEENGIIVREITLEGTFGITEKRARGFQGAQGGGNPLSGADHFEALRNLFRRYSARKKDPLTAAKTQMIFHALRDGDHFIVVPREFTTPRDAGKTRTHHEYRITLAAIAPAIQSGLVASRSGTDFFDDVTNVLRDINEGFNDMRAGIAEVTASLGQIKRKVGNINAILNGAIQLANAVGGFLAGATALINYPLQLAANVVEAVDGIADSLLLSVEGAAFGVFDENARSLRRISAAADKIIVFGDKFEATTRRIEDLYSGERRLTANDIDNR
ncbi:MAG TPA: hypothetical protein VFG22_10280, partial [Polyangiales bacterium]|nr:hypothetical protein [Polyangiales bacterium]